MMISIVGKIILGIVIIIFAVVGSVEDIRVIYALSALYGISSGILAVTESLMFADVFGMEKFPSVYGLVGLCKALLVLIISTAFHSPSASFVYIMDPMLHPKVNDTICTNCDPLSKLLLFYAVIQ